MIDRPAQLPTLNEADEWEYDHPPLPIVEKPQPVLPVQLKEKVRSPLTSEITTPTKPSEITDAELTQQKAQRALDMAQDFLAHPQDSVPLAVQVNRINLLTKNIDRALTSPDLSSSLKTQLQNTHMDLEGYRLSIEGRYSKTPEYQAFRDGYNRIMQVFDEIQALIAEHQAEAADPVEQLKLISEYIDEYPKYQKRLTNIKEVDLKQDLFKFDFFQKKEDEKNLVMRLEQTTDNLTKQFDQVQLELMVTLDSLIQDPDSVLRSPWIQVKKSNLRQVLGAVSKMLKSPLTQAPEKQQKLYQVLTAFEVRDKLAYISTSLDEIKEERLKQSNNLDFILRRFQEYLEYQQDLQHLDLQDMFQTAHFDQQQVDLYVQKLRLEVDKNLATLRDDLMEILTEIIHDPNSINTFYPESFAARAGIMSEERLQQTTQLLTKLLNSISSDPALQQKVNQAVAQIKSIKFTELQPAPVENEGEILPSANLNASLRKLLEGKRPARRRVT